MPARGRYVVLEGDEGAGKTSQLELLKPRLEAQGVKCEIVREPGGDPIAEQLREILKHSPHPLSPLAEVFGFCMARANMLEFVVKPLLEKGIWVLADRSYVSTLVYQGEGRGLNDDEHFRGIMGELGPKNVFNTIVTAGSNPAEPDLILILDVPLTKSMQRMEGRGEAVDRFEAEDLAFRQRVNWGYHWRSEANFRGFKSINAAQELQAVHEDIWKAIQTLFEEVV